MSESLHVEILCCDCTLVIIYCNYLDKGKVLVVTELSPYGDLLKYLRKIATIGLGEQEG